jgi:hypothetical protein
MGQIHTDSKSAEICGFCSDQEDDETKSGTLIQRQKSAFLCVNQRPAFFTINLITTKICGFPSARFRQAQHSNLPISDDEQRSGD